MNIFLLESIVVINYLLLRSVTINSPSINILSIYEFFYKFYRVDHSRIFITKMYHDKSISK